MHIGELVPAFVGWCARHRSHYAPPLGKGGAGGVGSTGLCGSASSPTCNRALTTLTLLEIDVTTWLHRASWNRRQRSERRMLQVVLPLPGGNGRSCFVAFILFCSNLLAAGVGGVLCRL